MLLWVLRILWVLLWVLWMLLWVLLRILWVLLWVLRMVLCVVYGLGVRMILGLEYLRLWSPFRVRGSLPPARRMTAVLLVRVGRGRLGV